MGKNEPRWIPTYAPQGNAVDVFLGYANELDVWWGGDAVGEVYIIGPTSKQIRPTNYCNFDALDVVDGNLIPRMGSEDLHIDVLDMCLIYALCVEHGVFKENTNEPK